MTVKDFKKWLEENKVPDNAEIFFKGPEGWEEFKPFEYNKKTNSVDAQGIG